MQVKVSLDFRCLSRKVWKNWACCQASAFSLLCVLCTADEWYYVFFPLRQNLLFSSIVILGEWTQATWQPHMNSTRKLLQTCFMHSIHCSSEFYLFIFIINFFFRKMGKSRCVVLKKRNKPEVWILIPPPSSPRPPPPEIHIFHFKLEKWFFRVFCLSNVRDKFFFILLSK